MLFLLFFVILCYYILLFFFIILPSSDWQILFVSYFVILLCYSAGDQVTRDPSLQPLLLLQYQSETPDYCNINLKGILMQYKSKKQKRKVFS